MAAKKKRVRQLRRAPDARALEWAGKRLERAIKLRDWHVEKLTALSAEIPRLQGIIEALRPTDVVHVSEVGHLTQEQIANMKSTPLPPGATVSHFPIPEGLHKYLIPRPSPKAHGGVVDAGLAPADEDALLPDKLPGKEVLP